MDDINYTNGLNYNSNYATPYYGNYTSMFGGSKITLGILWLVVVIFTIALLVGNGYVLFTTPAWFKCNINKIRAKVQKDKEDEEAAKNKK